MNKTYSFDFGLFAQYKVQMLDTAGVNQESLPEYHWNENGRTILNESQSAPVLIEPRGYAPWLATFSGVKYNSADIDGIYACPSKHHFLVIDGSVGFYVDSRTAGAIEILPTDCIQRVDKHLETGLLLISDFYSIVAISEKGILWQSKRLVLDGLEIGAVTNEYIAGIADCFTPTGYPYGFRVSVHDGSVIMGNDFTES